MSATPNPPRRGRCPRGPGGAQGAPQQIRDCVASCRLADGSSPESGPAVAVPLAPVFPPVPYVYQEAEALPNGPPLARPTLSLPKSSPPLARLFPPAPGSNQTGWQA